MSFLLAFMLASALGASVIALTILWATNRAAAAAITSYFQASEHILETHEPPPQWFARPWWRVWRGSSRVDCLARLDKMTRFFEQCGFFEDEFAREQLLSQLAAVRADWAGRADIAP